MLNDPVDGWLDSSICIGSAEAEVASTNLSLVLGPVVIDENRDGTNSSWNLHVVHVTPTILIFFSKAESILQNPLTFTVESAEDCSPASKMRSFSATSRSMACHSVPEISAVFTLG